MPSEVSDDRDSVEEGDRVVLIVEDDADFARTELEIARERGFKGIVALRGDTGLALAREFRPDAIVLDMTLPVLDGWTVLDRLKRHPATRHIPVHIVSGIDEMQPALMAGAAAFLQKPASAESSGGGVRRDRVLHQPRRSPVARRRRRRDPAGSDRRARRRRRGRRDRRRRLVGGSARGARRRRPVRLHGARPEAAEDDRLRAAREGQDRRAVAQPAGDRVHRQGADAARGDEAEALRRDDRRQGRPLAGAPARRDLALPAPGRVEAARLETQDARAAAQHGRALHRQEGADRRRRRSATSSR